MIYLDYSATSPMVQGVLDAMLPYLTDRYGNPSSKHALGMESRRAVETARGQVASFIGAMEGEVYFTSGGTESVATAFECALLRAGRAVVTSAAEHVCVLDTAHRWRQIGRGVTILPVDPRGFVSLDAIEATLSGLEPAFVSLIWGNNETGVISPIEEIAGICRRYGALIHVDAIQVPTRVEIDLRCLPIDYISLSAHKFGGPKGVGVFFARSGVPMSPLMLGHQERGFRGGTENVAGIVGTGEALRLQSDWKLELGRIGRLRNLLEAGILARVPGSSVNGDPIHRIAGVTNICLPGYDSAQLVAALGRAGVCASAGAACNGEGKPSHVLVAMGHSEDHANSSIRFSLGKATTEHDIQTALQAIKVACQSTMRISRK